MPSLLVAAAFGGPRVTLNGLAKKLNPFGQEEEKRRTGREDGRASYVGVAGEGQVELGCIRLCQDTDKFPPLTQANETILLVPRVQICTHWD